MLENRPRRRRNESRNLIEQQQGRGRKSRGSDKGKRRRNVIAVSAGKQSRGAFVGAARMQKFVRAGRARQARGGEQSEKKSETDAGAQPHVGGMVRRRTRVRKQNAPLDSARSLHYQSREMPGFTRVYFLVFGLLTIAGGIVGYVKAGSVISVLAGTVTGLVLLLAAYLFPEHLTAALILGGAVSLLLAAQFTPKFFRTGHWMPAGLMSVLSVLGVIVALVTALRK